jgi:flavin-dependent dehydrogenase
VSATVDVLVLGAGPAGAIAALNLAPTHRVILVDRRTAPPVRIGESLPPAARALLSAMGLWEAFLAEGHAPCHGNRAWWGSTEPTETDFLRDPEGPGWHLDRTRFEAWLRREAVARGAVLVCPATLRAVARQADRWQVALDRPQGPVELQVRALIDASGRSASLARRLGARRVIDDRLVCGWVHLSDDGGRGAGLTHVIAEPDGWWYTAPLPNGRRVLAFHTDADLPAVRDARTPETLLARAAHVDAIAELIPAIRDARSPEALLARTPRIDTVGEPSSAAGAASAHRELPSPAAGFTAAHGATLTPAAGELWAATGDAALAFDPLSSQGLLNCLFTGLAVAEAMARSLDGAHDALPGYADTLAGIRKAYTAHLKRWYAEEQRWQAHPFWSRRHALR